MATGTYQVALSAFEGPFDLLLHLIARHEVDIYAVPLAQITDDYLAVLRDLDTVDLEVATEFLVVAATLVELKAARLLPDTDDPELDELVLEARDLLYARLLDYRTFKEASAWLGARMVAAAGHHPRSALMEPRFAALRPDVVLNVDAAGLAVLAARVLADAMPRTVDMSHVQPQRMSVAEAVTLVAVALRRAGGRATFRALTAPCRDRADVVVSFLAVLELYKTGAVELEQVGSFGELRVRELVGEGAP